MSRKISIAFLLIGIAFSYFVISGKNYLPVSLASPAGAPGTGVTAPGFTLSDMQGKPVSLADYRGKVVVLNFWASWCPPCRAEMPSMERLYGTLKGNDFVLLAVNVEKNGRSAVAAFSQKIPMSFPVLLDSDQHVSGLYRVGGIPQTFIINKKGEIVQEVTGARDWNSPETRKFLTTLMQGE
jgi:peroxiredoxin